jgi:hypothetical protein
MKKNREAKKKELLKTLTNSEKSKKDKKHHREDKNRKLKDRKRSHGSKRL